MEKKYKENLNYHKINEVVNLSTKILNLVYVLMIIGIIFISTLLIKEWGILKFIITLLKIATPFFIGFVLAWLFNPIVIKLENRGWKRGLSCAVVYLVFIAIIGLFFGMLIPTIYNQINDLILALPSIINSIQEWISNIFNGMQSTELINVNELKETVFNSIELGFTNLTTNLPTMIVGIFGSLMSGLGTIAVGLVVGIYLLLDFNNVNNYFLKYIPDKHKGEVQELCTEIGEEVRKCVKGTLLVATMVFVFDSIGFAIAGLKAPLLFGLLCGVTDLIPYIGPYIGGAAAVVVGYSQGPIIGTIVLIIAVVVQLVENYILQPVVMSKTTSLHPVAIIIGLLIFGHFFGIIGMILATSIMSLLKVLYKFFAKKYNLFNRDIF